MHDVADDITKTIVHPASESEQSECHDIVHLLWTGGWDSTYRVLELLEQGRDVQPHYLIDKLRSSTKCEIKAMDDIRKSIVNLPETLSGTLLPTKISEKAGSISNPKISAAYNEILKRFYVGEQYMWLADYCDKQAITNMEIGVEKNPIVVDAVASKGYPYSEIFDRFEFPILSVGKLEMKTWAQDRGLLPVLEQSWFCHTPTDDSVPCGVCHPCEVSMQGGMGYRLPLKSRIRYRLRVVPRVKALLKKFPRFYHALYSLKHNR